MLAVFLASILVAQRDAIADEVVFKVDDQSVIAPDATAARYAVAMCRSLKVGTYRVEPLDDGSFKVSCTNGFVTWSSGRSRILGGYWNGSAIVVPADKVMEKGYRSEQFAKKVEGGISIDANQDDFQEVLFDIMKEVRRSYQVAPNIYGIVTLNLVHESHESLVGLIVSQIGGLYLIDGDDLIVINNPGILKRKNVGFRGIRSN